MTINEINTQIQSTTAQVETYMENNYGRVIVKVHKPSTAPGWSTYGTIKLEKTGKEKEAFSSLLARILDDSQVYSVRIEVYSRGGKGSGEPKQLHEIKLKDNVTPIVYATQEQEPVAEPQPKAEPEPLQRADMRDMIEMFSVACFGKPGLGRAYDEMGTAGVMLHMQKQAMEDKFEREKQETKHLDIMKENERLKVENENQKEKIADLTAEITELRKKLDEQSDYESLKSKTGQIAAIGTQVLSGTLLTLAQKSPLGALLGFGDMPPVPHHEHNVPDDDEVSVEEDKEVNHEGGNGTNII